MNAALLPKPLPALKYRIEHRRWVRKGTFSCWQCKRRKIRCIRDTTKGPCKGCRRRKLTCVGQEYPDNSAEAGDDQLCDKLTRLECLILDLGNKMAPSDEPYNRPNSTRKSLTNFSNGQIAYYPEVPLPYIDQHSVRQWTSIDRGEYSSAACGLLEAWPCLHDLESILSMPGEIPALFHGTICGPPSIVLPAGSLCARQLIHLPQKGSHPTLIMRQLLLLATWLQSFPPFCIHELQERSINHRDLQRSIFKAAHRYGISNSEMLDSIEGIECIMIETMYLNNTGDLGRAWRSINRAIPIAQTMGLHQNAQSQRPRFLDEQTSKRIFPDYMWFRLVQMNRYLAMMLGLPQGTTNNIFADVNVLQTCSPVERLQRMDCATGGYILQRNEAGLFDQRTTQMIDHMLRESAECFPTAWWAKPDLSTCVDQPSKLVEEIARVMDQLTHYYLVAQLHLPYITRSFADCDYEHSKKMAVDASREVLMRYTSLQGVHAFASFCSGTNLLAFICCTILCIAHISAKRGQQDHVPGYRTVLGSLSDQHTSDRELLEFTLDGMQRIAREDNDPIASRTSSILTNLLAMEASGAICEKDTSVSMSEPERGLGCGGKVSDCNRVLEIYVPYFGTTRFERRDNIAYVSRRLHFI